MRRLPGVHRLLGFQRYFSDLCLRAGRRHSWISRSRSGIPEFRTPIFFFFLPFATANGLSTTLRIFWLLRKSRKAITFTSRLSSGFPSAFSFFLPPTLSVTRRSCLQTCASSPHGQAAPKTGTPLISCIPNLHSHTPIRPWDLNPPWRGGSGCISKPPLIHTSCDLRTAKHGIRTASHTQRPGTSPMPVGPLHWEKARLICESWHVGDLTCLMCGEIGGCGPLEPM
jgi:hypothetical protein